MGDIEQDVIMGGAIIHAVSGHGRYDTLYNTPCTGFVSFRKPSFHLFNGEARTTFVSISDTHVWVVLGWVAGDLEFSLE